MPDGTVQLAPQVIPGITPALNQILFDYTLPVTVIVSYLRLLALIQPGDERRTPPLDVASELPLLLGLQRTQVRKHLKLLRMAKLIAWSTDSAGRYRISFLLEKSGESAKATCGVVGVYPDINQNQDDLQQQQTGVAKTTSMDDPPAASAENPAFAGDLPPTAVQREGPEGLRQLAVAALDNYGAPELHDGKEWQVFEQVMRWLARAGVWTDQAVRIARRIAENERREHEYLPGRGDVLGWIAYCFAYHYQNEIKRPVRVLAANLINNRRCPDHLRAVRICSSCRFQEGFCQCQAEPQYFYPEDFLEFAFTTDFDPDHTNFWGVCRTCHAFRCQCPYRQADQETEEGESRGYLHGVFPHV